MVRTTIRCWRRGVSPCSARELSAAALSAASLAAAVCASCFTCAPALTACGVDACTAAATCGAASGAAEAWVVVVVIVMVERAAADCWSPAAMAVVESVVEKNMDASSSPPPHARSRVNARTALMRNVASLGYDFIAGLRLSIL